MRMFDLTPVRRPDGLVDLFRDVERVFEDFGRGLQPAAGWASDRAWLAPRMNVAETQAGLEVTAEMPGVCEKDIDIQVEGKTLTLKAHREEAEEKSDKTYHLVERRSGSFSRSMTLPFEVEADKVEATFRDGILTLKLPKPPAAKVEVKRIEVKN